MFKGLGEWTITRQTGSNNRATYLKSDGSVGNGYIHIEYGHRAIRPCFYLKNNVTYISGDGSYNNPYKIDLE